MCSCSAQGGGSRLCSGELEKAERPDQSTKEDGGCLQGQLNKTHLYPIGSRKAPEIFE